MKLMKMMRYGYVSIIKKYPKGLGNRMRRFDEWALTGNHPQVKTYYDYFYNLEGNHFQVNFPETQASKYDIDQVSTFYRPKLKEIIDNNTYSDQEVIGDYQLSQDISQMTLKNFVKEGLNKQTRTHLHLYALWLIITSIFCSISLAHLCLYSDYKQQNIMFDPDPSFDHYNPNILQWQVRGFIDKINMLNSHSKDVLLEAKKKAGA